LLAKEDARSKPHRKSFPLHRSVFRRMAMTPQLSRNNVKGARGGFIAWTNVLSSCYTLQGIPTTQRRPVVQGTSMTKSEPQTLLEAV
jgi:hypothetical protein